MIGSWEVKNLWDTHSNQRRFLPILGSTLLLLVTGVVICVRFFGKNEVAFYTAVYVPIIILFLVTAYFVYQLRNRCTLELYEDHFIQSFNTKSFGKTPSDRIVRFNEIYSYKTYTITTRNGPNLTLQIKIQAATLKTIDFTIKKNLPSSTKAFEDFIDSFIYILEKYVENHPEDYSPHSWLRFREDDWGWVVVGRK